MAHHCIDKENMLVTIPGVDITLCQWPEMRQKGDSSFFRLSVLCDGKQPKCFQERRTKLDFFIRRRTLTVENVGSREANLKSTIVGSARNDDGLY
jgi:hypothetical protein